MTNDAFETPDDWSYAGATGPEHWSEIAPLCEYGEQQSPIDLHHFTPAKLEPLRFDYDARAERIVNNGHCIQVHFEPGAALHVGERRYALDHLHFHVPSEHCVEGHGYDMEAHFVNQDATGNVAVIALLYSNGELDPAFAKLGSRLPESANGSIQLADTLLAAEFLPDSHDYYYYVGSLTTPPATEGVAWYILKAVQSIALEEARLLLKADDGPNARPLQARNERKVFTAG
jgi:carbonic anhydrase